MDGSQVRPREEELEEPAAKRPRIAELVDHDREQLTLTSASASSSEPVLAAQAPSEPAFSSAEQPPTAAPPEPNPTQQYSTTSLHPPSLSLLLPPRPPSVPKPAQEPEVGINQYLSFTGKVEGIVKQRFTDFLVFEVDLNGEVVHVKDIGPPQVVKKSKPEISSKPEDKSPKPEIPDSEADTSAPTASLPSPSKPAKAQKTTYDWTPDTGERLKPWFGAEAMEALERLWREGKEVPLVSDMGWEGRRVKGEAGDEGRKDGAEGGKDGFEGGKEGNTEQVSGQDGKEAGEAPPGEAPVQEVKEPEPQADKGRRDRNGRGGRGGRDRGRGRGGARGGRADTRQVLSDPISSKEGRTELHKAVRELFGGQLETETVESQGNRIRVKWCHNPRGGGQRGRGGDRGGGKGDRNERDALGQYIHFTLQKTNRDSHDALQDEGQAGVTCQRVCLKRFNRTLVDVWRGVNAVGRRRTEKDALTARGERGVRISDLAYSKTHLDLGMLRGNEFVITLRNVKVDILDTIEQAMVSLRDKGFINYYGMQRFGTAAIPTHATGLALLHSDWKRACELLLMPRPGEDPEVERARKAWAERHDAAQALVFMPRRVVAETCVLEYYRDHGSSNHLDALMKIPRNLRLMYIHAYQSYVWNAMVSERIKRYGSESPIVGDLVFDVPRRSQTTEDGVDLDLAEEQPETKTGRPGRPKVKELTEDDLSHYSIFDVILPLPGHSVQMPGGEFGELYKRFLEADGLTMASFSKPQKEFSLAGSYRKILHQVKNLSWKTMHYTDPSLPLAQTDEDKILGFDVPVVDPNGKFLALQVQFTLGPAAYATMALREITKTETSSQFQSALTQASEDQAYKGVGEATEETTVELAADDLDIDAEVNDAEDPSAMQVDGVE